MRREQLGDRSLGLAIGCGRAAFVLAGVECDGLASPRSAERLPGGNAYGVFLFPLCSSDTATMPRRCLLDRACFVVVFFAPFFRHALLVSC